MKQFTDSSATPPSALSRIHYGHTFSGLPVMCVHKQVPVWQGRQLSSLSNPQ